MWLYRSLHGSHKQSGAVAAAYLWPLTLMLLTLGSLKSHTKSGYRKGAMKPPEAASTCTVYVYNAHRSGTDRHIHSRSGAMCSIAQCVLLCCHPAVHNTTQLMNDVTNNASLVAKWGKSEGVTACLTCVGLGGRGHMQLAGTPPPPRTHPHTHCPSPGTSQPLAWFNSSAGQVVTDMAEVQGHRHMCDSIGHSTSNAQL